MNLKHSTLWLSFTILCLCFIMVETAGSDMKEDVLTQSYQKAFATSSRMASIGNYDEAIVPLLALYQHNQKNYMVTVRLGYLYNLKRDFDASVLYYKQAAKIKPDAVEPLLGLLLPLINQTAYR